LGVAIFGNQKFKGLREKVNEIQVSKTVLGHLQAAQKLAKTLMG